MAEWKVTVENDIISIFDGEDVIGFGSHVDVTTLRVLAGYHNTELNTLATENADLTRRVAELKADKRATEAYGALRDRVIETALDSKNTKQVLYVLYEMLADGSLPDVCLLCSGIGQIRTGVDTETTCNACGGSGVTQDTDLYTDELNHYEFLASRIAMIDTDFIPNTTGIETQSILNNTHAVAPADAPVQPLDSDDSKHVAHGYKLNRVSHPVGNNGKRHAGLSNVALCGEVLAVGFWWTDSKRVPYCQKCLHVLHETPAASENTDA